MNAYPFNFLVDHQNEIREFASREELRRQMVRPPSKRGQKPRVMNLLLAVMMMAATPWR